MHDYTIMRKKMDRKLVGAIIVAVLAIGAIAGCVDVEEPAPEVTPTPTEVTPPEVTPTPTPLPAVAAVVSCDICHVKEATVELSAHVEGGKSCFGTALGPCHSAEKYGGPDATVHTVHPPEVTCRQCHIVEGELTIPTTGKYTSCEVCHAVPNPLKPSDGRLVEIHVERGRDCQVCHVGEISEVHAGVM